MKEPVDQSQIHRALGRIEGKLDGITSRLDSGAHRMDKLEDRVANNEKRVWKISGATGVVAAFTVVASRWLPWANLFS